VKKIPVAIVGLEPGTPGSAVQRFRAVERLWLANPHRTVAMVNSATL